MGSEQVVTPTIMGPCVWPADGPPPRFDVDAAGLPLFMVELATAAGLMTCVAERTSDNYYYGGDADGGFATGCGWSVPRAVWAHLSRARLLYYRLVAVDQATGTSALSVEDQDLATLPALRLESSTGTWAPTGT